MQLQTLPEFIDRLSILRNVFEISLSNRFYSCDQTLFKTLYIQLNIEE